jgi:hypothetical protein
VKKVLLSLFFVVLGWNVFAGGTMDVSAISAEDVAKIELIVEALEPEFAIQTALDSFPKSSYPLNDYLKVQEMKINRIFNEYGIEFNHYAAFEGLSPWAQVAYTKLKSRYSYLDSMELKGADELRAALALLRD